MTPGTPSMITVPRCSRPCLRQGAVQAEEAELQRWARPTEAASSSGGGGRGSSSRGSSGSRGIMRTSGWSSPCPVCSSRARSASGPPCSEWWARGTLQMGQVGRRVVRPGAGIRRDRARCWDARWWAANPGHHHGGPHTAQQSVGRRLTSVDGNERALKAVWGAPLVFQIKGDHLSLASRRRSCRAAGGWEARVHPHAFARSGRWGRCGRPTVVAARTQGLPTKPAPALVCSPSQSARGPDSELEQGVALQSSVQNPSTEQHWLSGQVATPGPQTPAGGATGTPT